MKDLPLISVIVPIYKVERFLPLCLNSIIEQTYKNLEIILVDDGSPDKCGAICDEYAIKDLRITVIHKINGGLSDARNVGITTSQGKYITFVDSDDYLESTCIEKLYLAIMNTSSDIAICNFYFKKESSNNLKIAFRNQIDITLSNNDALKNLLYQNNIETSAWGKLFKKELWETTRFPKGKLFEDISTIYKTFLDASRIAIISNPLYVYILRDDSIMGSKFDTKKMQAIYSTHEMLEGIKKTGKKELITAAYCRYISMCFNILFQTDPKSNEEKYILNEIKKYRKKTLLDFHARLKTKIALLFSYGNMSILRIIYSKINQ